MPQVKCTQCLKINHWQAKRGARLVDARCDECGGTLKRSNPAPGKAMKSKSYQTCEICNNKRLALITTKTAMRNRLTLDSYPAGIKYCAIHADVLLPADDLYFYYMDLPVTQANLERILSEIEDYLRDPTSNSILARDIEICRECVLQWKKDINTRTDYGLINLRNVMIDLLMRLKNHTKQNIFNDNAE